MKNNILYTFGDSHSRCKSWKTLSIPNLTIKWYDGKPYTMARFSMEKINLLNIKDYGVEDGNLVCFCFGEIDCRTHYSKPENLEIYKELINEIVPRYFEAIKLNVEQFKNLTTMVFNIVPPTKLNDWLIQHYKEHNADINIAFPGIDKDRRSVTLYMNSKLKEYCEKNNYIFFDVYDDYSDSDGFLSEDLKDEAVHISNPIYMEGFLEKFLEKL